MRQMAARIFKADGRALYQTEGYYNFSMHESGIRSQLLAGFDDVVIEPGGVLDEIISDFKTIVLPIAGSIHFRDDEGHDEFLSAEDVLQSAGKFRIMNNTSERSNFLVIRLASAKGNNNGFSKAGFSFPERNILIPVGAGMFEKELLFSGIYDGRKDGIYILKDPLANGVFAFVINGAFEFANRLLESRDALEIRGTESVEFEALSENAILFLMELPVMSELFPLSQ